MIRSIILSAVVLGSLVSMNACIADSSNEGQSCSKQSDCGGNLVCQPIENRKETYCCPTPAETSSESNCKAAAPAPAK